MALEATGNRARKVPRPDVETGRFPRCFPRNPARFVKTLSRNPTVPYYRCYAPRFVTTIVPEKVVRSSTALPSP